MKTKNFLKQSGQTIVEVLIVTVVIATILTALAASLTMSANNTNQSKQRSLATTYAQEGLEVFRRERNSLGWNRFYESLNSSTYCLNDLPVDSAAFVSLVTGECASGTTIENTGLQREAVVSVGADQVDVSLSVTWFDGAEEKTVSVDQSFQDI